MKVSTKNQVTLTKDVRKVLHIHPGDHLAFDPKTHKLLKVPTKSEWAKVIDQLPGEEVDIDKHGHYNAKKSPKFHQWMTKG